MKKHIAMLCAVLLTALAAFAPGAAAAGPALTATEAYCIIDADTGLVLAQQNMNEELHPASITKVMTLGLACEKAQGKWDNVKLTVSHEDVYSLAGTDSSHIALQEGEEVPLTDALYATMMASANDGANLLAEYFGGGSIEGGVAAMNAQAKELGLEHTHFANPHGISDEDHYTSCYDMAQILRWALTFAFVNLAWVFFRAPDVPSALALLRQALTGGILKPEDWLVDNLFRREGAAVAILLPALEPWLNRLKLGLLFLAGTVAALLPGNTIRRMDTFRPTLWRALLLSLGSAWAILSFTGVGNFLYSNF